MGNSCSKLSSTDNSHAPPQRITGTERKGNRTELPASIANSSSNTPSHNFNEPPSRTSSPTEVDFGAAQVLGGRPIRRHQGSSKMSAETTKNEGAASDQGIASPAPQQPEDTATSNAADTNAVPASQSSGPGAITLTALEWLAATRPSDASTQSFMLRQAANAIASSTAILSRLETQSNIAAVVPTLQALCAKVESLSSALKATNNAEKTVMLDKELKEALAELGLVIADVTKAAEGEGKARPGWKD